jgi:hypothetical protein
MCVILARYYCYNNYSLISAILSHNLTFEFKKHYSAVDTIVRNIYSYSNFAFFNCCRRIFIVHTTIILKCTTIVVAILVVIKITNSFALIILVIVLYTCILTYSLEVAEPIRSEKSTRFVRIRTRSDPIRI